ncbi:MAG: chemotaxis protein CheW [Chloroflexota bacterium]
MELRLDATPEDLRVFLEEAYEQLQLLDTDLVALEKTGPQPELVQEVFRVAHTLKGSSASIGHTRMAELTHAMESALDGVRQGVIAVTAELTDLLLESLDALRLLTDEVATLTVSDIDISALGSRLLNLAGEGRASRGSEDVLEGRLSARQSECLYDHQAMGSNVYRVTVELDAAAALPGVRCLQILLELSALAEVIHSTPEQTELESGKESYRLEALCATKVDADALQSALSSIIDVVRVRVTPYEPEDGGAEDERVIDRGPQAIGLSVDRRITNLGRGARGQSPEELQCLTARSAQQSKTVRIDVERLDNLMNLVGELVLDNTRLAQIANQLRLSHSDEGLVERLGELSSHLTRLTDELQQEVMKSRMQPVESVFAKFPRMVRNLARKADKQVELIVQGQETEVDRSVIEEIGDPLIHLLRNAVDHGIETAEERRARGKPPQGTIRLSAFHQENHIVLTVEDDGRGIDPNRIRVSAAEKGLLTAEAAERLNDREALELIFAPGFSTVDRVSEMSGRGVGMDIVRTNIEHLNGSVSVETVVGQGSKFTIKLPLTLAIVRSLLVSVSDAVYAIPLVFVTETTRLDTDQIRTVRTREAMQFRGQVLPLMRLRDLFSISPNGRGDVERAYVVVIKHAGRQVGLVVDRLIGEQEVVIKSLSRLMGDVKGISGAAILGDGRVGLIIDASALVQVAIDEQMGRARKP